MYCFNLIYSQIKLKRYFSLSYFVMYFVLLRGKKSLNLPAGRHKVAQRVTQRLTKFMN